MDFNHLVGGAVNGFGLAIVAIVIPRYTRHILAAALGVAALFYVGFALDAGTGSNWLVVELAGVGIYGYAAVRGVRGSAWWLVAGWALHPVWDVALHYAGPARGVAPEWYTTSCLTYDVMVAGMTAIAIVIGTHLTGTPARSLPSADVSPLRTPVCTCTCESCTASGARAA